MSLGNHIFRVHLTHHPFMTKIHISFIIGTHSLSDKVDNFLLMSNIHLDCVTPICIRCYFYPSFCGWK